MTIFPLFQGPGLRLGVLALFLAAPAMAPAAPTAAEPHAQVFAEINGRKIPTQEYEAAFASLVRQKFYHGQVPASELAVAREEVKKRLVQRIVLLEEAARRGIAADGKQVEQTLAGYDSRYAGNPNWLQNREQLLPGLKLQLEEQSLVSQLEQQIRQVPEPGDSEVRAFYDSKPELFTEPEKLRLSVIQLKVDPSSPATAWDGTRKEAQTIYQRLLAGADFADAARLHSGIHADTGGDMGYLHRGMLPEVVQAQVDKFEMGKVNEPLETLEGVAILRLDDRLPPKKREFADVAPRARELLIRELQAQAWKSLVDRLVAAADVKFLHSMNGEQREGGN